MTDQQLEERLHKLVKADILAGGSSNFHYRGLGDKIFAMVFRRIYGAEIERVSTETIEDEFKQQLDKARRRAARYKGVAAEYKVRYRLQAAALAGAALADFVTGSPPPEMSLDRFRSIRKAQFHLDQERSVEVDLHAVSEREDGLDLVVEVKDWERAATLDVARRFVEAKAALAGYLERTTAFLFYSESGVGGAAAAELAAAGILIVDDGKLAGYEMPPPEL
jgi:hypothetical protein